ncbi:MAG: tRNA (N(6)-L-threonylcarbamoyladenosine(37)-C(2))-methylthiotransferase MtaB [Candidatus Sulfotelmatobacter sp.]
MATFHVENFGCRATQADGAALERQFESRGLARATTSDADLVILNTCTVTNAADQDARAAIRRVRRKNPNAKIVVTGCYAQRAPEEIAAMPGVSAVIGNSHKHELARLVLQNVSAPEQAGGFSLLPISALTEKWQEGNGSSIFVSDIFAHTELLAAPVFEPGNGYNGDRTRPNLKVQDGCNNRCSFCVIPSVRGKSRSLPLERVIAEVNTLVTAGYKELVISGINLGRWGRDLVWGARPRVPKGAGSNLPQTFLDLVRAILAETKLEKLRISSVEPMDWTDDLISLVASSPRIAKHAHVPLQSGSDAVLRRMQRRYRPWHYREKIERIHAAMPMAAIGADVMAGFPGESDAEFECTRRLIEELPFTYLHVFTYSPRPGTAAAAMPKQVPVHVARERNKILRDLATEKKLAFMRSFVGKRLDAITLSGADNTPDGEHTEALTDNYQKLYLRGRLAPNRWIAAQISAVQDGVLHGVSAGMNLPTNLAA